jgi:molecular chaperone GrpE
MFRDYDPYGRRNGRSPQITNIPGPNRQQTVDPLSEIMRLRQQLEQTTADSAEWQQAAQKYYAIAQQQQAELTKREQQLVSLQKEISRRPVLSRVEVDAEAQRERENKLQEAKTETQKSVQSVQSVDKTENNEWQVKYTRLYAEFENSKKRLEQRYALESQQNQEKLLRDMLPLADNLERAIAHTESDPDGLRLIQKVFLDALAKYGVERMEVAERPFSPEHHEAIGMIPHPTAESGTVVTVAENGYTYKGVLLRPAKVLVAQ